MSERVKFCLSKVGQSHFGETFNSIASPDHGTVDLLILRTRLKAFESPPYVAISRKSTCSHIYNPIGPRMFAFFGIALVLRF
jgi:hypothetical protein